MTLKARHPRLALTIVALAAFLPFLDRPVFFDDHAIFTEVLDVANGRTMPFAPRSANEAGWVPGETPTEANPPAYPFILGTFVRIAGAEFWKSHAFVALLQIAGLLCFYEVARWLVDQPLWASFMLLFSPAYFLTGYSLLVDGLLAPAVVASLWAWMKGEESGKAGWFLAAGLLALLAALVKYTGLLAVGILGLRVVFGPAGQRMRRALWLALPVALFGLWWVWTRQLYGESHMAAVARASLRPPDLSRLFILVAFVAATIPAVLVLVTTDLLRGKARRRWLTVAAIGSSAIVGFALLPSGHGVALGVMGGLFFAWAIAAFGAPRSDKINLLLQIWILAGLCGLLVARGWVCGRYLVIVAPAVVLLTVWRVEKLRRGAVSAPLKIASVIVLAVFTGLLAQADYRRAQAEREAGEALNQWARLAAPKRAVFPAAAPTGIGFYLDRKLWTGVPPGFPLERGDVAVLPLQTLAPRFHPSIEVPVPVAEFAYQSWNPFRLIDRGSLAGYYGSIWGPLPLSLSREPLERFVIVREDEKR